MAGHYITPTPESHIITKSKTPTSKGPPFTAEHSHDSQIARLFNDGLRKTDCRASQYMRSAFTYEEPLNLEPSKVQRSVAEMETLWTRGFLVSDSAYTEAVRCLEIIQEIKCATQEASIELHTVTRLIPPPGLKGSKTNIRMDMEFGLPLPASAVQANRHN